MSRQLSFVLVLLSLSLFSLAVSAGVGKNKNAMLLQDVSTLIFTKGEMTNARRSSPVPQMTCKGGPCQYAPQTAMCRNIGFDGTDVTWQCEAELPKGVKFGKVEVSCEGFNSRDDEQVLKGSCGLEYRLVGDARYDSEVKEEDTWWNRNVRGSAGKHSGGASSHHRSASGAGSGQSWWGWLTGAQSAAAEHYQHAHEYAQHQYDKASDYMQHGAHGGHHSHHQSTGVFGLLSYLVSTIFSMGVKLIAAAIVFFVIWRLMRPAASTVPQPAARRPGMLRSALGMLGSGLFGGAGTNNNNPPPPYASHHNAPPPPYEPSGYEKRYSSTAPPQQQQQSQQSGSGYSALHGLLGGSLVGYLLGRARGGQQQPTATYTQQPGTVHHVHHNAPPVNPAYVRSEQRYPTATTRAGGSATRADGSSIEDISDVRTTETSTAYATTKRR